MVAPITDSTDLRLVSELQRDARQTNRALASAVALAPSTTLNRVRELERRGVIGGYHAEVDLAALGRGLQALVFVRLQPNRQYLQRIADRTGGEVISLNELDALSRRLKDQPAPYMVAP